MIDSSMMPDLHSSWHRRKTVSFGCFFKAGRYFLPISRVTGTFIPYVLIGSLKNRSADSLTDWLPALWRSSRIKERSSWMFSFSVTAVNTIESRYLSLLSFWYLLLCTTNRIICSRLSRQNRRRILRIEEWERKDLQRTIRGFLVHASLLRWS